MKMFKPITDLWKQVQALTENAGSFLETASGKGLQGIIADFMNLNFDGLIKQVDSEMGVGVIRLVSDGNQKDVDTAIRFRDYIVEQLEEMRSIAETIEKFGSDEIADVNMAVEDMATFLKDREPHLSRARRERALEAELDRLRRMVKEMSEYLGDQGLPGAGAEPEGKGSRWSAPGAPDLKPGARKTTKEERGSMNTGAVRPGTKKDRDRS